MTNTKKIIATITVAVIAIICVISSGYNLKYFFAEMIYGGKNAIDSRIIFSKQSGFYDDAFYLKIYAPSGEIYYTLDGSDPTIESMKYESPILISDATNNENVYSMRTDVCGSFLTEDSMYKVPEFLVDKCNVIKVAYYDESNQRSRIETRTYFVDFDEKQGYENINVVSITTDPENLFSDDKGIYVLGDTFKEFCENNDITQTNYYRWNANFLNRGIDWEREADIEIFNENKELVLEQRVGIRIQGGVSRGLLPKSLNFYARDEYGDNRMRYDFFHTGYYPQRVTLSGGGNDYYGKMLDRLGAELTQDLEFCTMNYEPYALFLNGEYWGFYYLTEKYDDHYIEHYYDVQSDNVIIVKNDKLEVGTEEDFNVYQQMKSFVEYADMTQNENYTIACTMLDMESFIDYFAAEIYMARQVDWPSANFSLWRSRTISDQPYEDGKWRWMLFDVNTAAMVDDYIDHDTLGYVISESMMFANLYTNAEFRKQFTDKIYELSETVFDANRVAALVDGYVGLMSEPMEKNHQRFFMANKDDFLYRAQIMKDFAEQRSDFIETMLEAH